jgi:8-oxo-dGTP pyrophosphatase MutT (NUDIX family)
MGGSILPITIINGKVYLLFGKERDIDENPGWSDFGGGTDKGETFIQTASREGMEEMTGFLGNETDVKKLLKKYGTFPIDYKSDGYSTYRAHIFPMEYDPSLPFYYNNNQRFLQKKLDPKIIRDSKIFEKTQIKWFPLDTLKSHRPEFRNFYKNIIDLILENKNAIRAFVFKKLRSKAKSKRFYNNTTTSKKTRKTKKY